MKFVNELDKRGVLGNIIDNNKKIHFLGMLDGPNEIELIHLAGYGHIIDTWDSSAAMWAGLHGIEFDNSPTGSINGKFEKEVDFSWTISDSNEIGQWKDSVAHNLSYIDNLCTEINNYATVR